MAVRRNPTLFTGNRDMFPTVRKEETTYAWLECHECGALAEPLTGTRNILSVHEVPRTVGAGRCEASKTRTDSVLTVC